MNFKGSREGSQGGGDSPLSRGPVPSWPGGPRAWVCRPLAQPCLPVWERGPREEGEGASPSRVFSVEGVTPGGLSWGPRPGRLPRTEAGPAHLRLLALLHKDRGEKPHSCLFSFPSLQVGKSRPRDLRCACQPHSKASGPSPWYLPRAAPGLMPGCRVRQPWLGFPSLSLKAWLPGLSCSNCVTVGRRFHCWALVSCWEPQASEQWPQCLGQMSRCVSSALPCVTSDVRSRCGPTFKNRCLTRRLGFHLLLKSQKLGSCWPAPASLLTPGWLELTMTPSSSHPHPLPGRAPRDRLCCSLGHLDWRPPTCLN